MIATANIFSQSELGKFDELAQRWWGEAARSRTTGSRAGKRLRMDAQAGTLRHGRLGAYS
jgi:2-polyprenyl-3-methyl-5-hydroxy-6-metoxy-1,4-benzoquinol methylase